MTYYHCSPTAGITLLEPRKPESFDKPAKAYLTTLLPMALLYGIRNYEYSYGYTKAGQIYLDEYFPNALEALYRGKSASLYICAPGSVEATEIPNEAVSEQAVPIVKEITIPDVCEALLEQERLGALVIHRYQELQSNMLDWIRRAEADSIREYDLLNTPGEMADYYRRHYPQSWAIVEMEQQLYHGSAVPALTELRPLSVLHGSDEKVVYLSSNVPYTLLYIWDAEKTQYSRKWVTGWVKDGIAYYEEQFHGQLKAFYEGVRGYVYSVLKSGDVTALPHREDLFCSKTPIRVYRVTEIPDVYQALLEYERAGQFHVLRYENASVEKQAELTERIAAYITQNNLPEQDSEESHFMKRYFAQAWEKAKN